MGEPRTWFAVWQRAADELGLPYEGLTPSIAVNGLVDKLEQQRADIDAMGQTILRSEHELYEAKVRLGEIEPAGDGDDRDYAR